MSLRSSFITTSVVLLLAASTASCQKPRTAPPVLGGSAAPAEGEPLAEPVLAEGSLEEVTVRRGDGLELTLTIGGGEYALRSERLAGEQLEGRRFELGSVAGIHARLTCDNADCSDTTIQIRREDRVATVTSRTLKLAAELGQVRDGCEVPLFFAEDLEEMLRDYPGFEAKIDGIRAMRELSASVLSVTGWEGEAFENLTVEGRDLVAFAREDRTSSVLEAQLTSWGLEGARVRIHRRAPGDPSSLSSLAFELTELGAGELEGVEKRVCVDLRIMPLL